ncbi:hypothetical protein RJ639_014337 [Escallonia herrerae]|uniref:RING-type E3 ubiquitin transferase n=1 Tax=Escallonia herrerae TaxID=1293975 RepID=A0AA88VKD8_9ASTE|nr:hypothetical protein RJ639_014337 [Escallonia herrerae]
MWPRGNNGERAPATHQLVAVAIDRDKGSKIALKWTIDTLLSKGQTLVLVHVKVKPSGSSTPRTNQISDVNNGTGSVYGDVDSQTQELFLPFHCFCTRKDVQCQDVVLEDTDVVKALVEYVSQSGIEVLVLGAAPKGGLLKRFKAKDIPGSVSKGAPDFCTVYVISKGKISSTRAASRPPPNVSPLRNQILSQASSRHDPSETQTPPTSSSKGIPRPQSESPQHSLNNDANIIKSPFTHRRDPNGKSYGELSSPDTDISFVSSGRPSIDRLFPSYGDSFEMGATPRFSNYSDVDRQSFESFRIGRKSADSTTPPELSYSSFESDMSSPSQAADEVEAEMRRLKLELKQTMDMLEEARLAEEAALAVAEKEKARSKAALEHAEAAQRIAELEAQKRRSAEIKALKEAEEKDKVLDALAKSDVRYRKYSIEELETATEFFSESRKIGEGGYGPVYKCYLDHTPVAVKVLRPDAAQGRSQFQQEVEVLSCIRHPNMVLLLGACPEYGCLVYEYMSNGSLEDCLLRRTPTLSWRHRFRIAAEIGTGLLFLHQTKPEPLVHRDLKPANILLDRNYVSKISDVGLARLVPPSVADNVTQYRMTSTAGTFCYIDPEYQQTGMLGIKSDIYSLGIMFLQLITAKPPMGLTHHVEKAIERGSFAEMLDQTVPDWPVEEALSFAKMALKCAELRRKDRPDLGKVVMPELERLRALAEENMAHSMLYSAGPSPTNSQVSMSQENLSYPMTAPSDYSSRSRSSTGT